MSANGAEEQGTHSNSALQMFSNRVHLKTIYVLGVAITVTYTVSIVRKASDVVYHSIIWPNPIPADLQAASLSRDEEKVTSRQVNLNSSLISTRELIPKEDWKGQSGRESDQQNLPSPETHWSERTETIYSNITSQEETGKEKSFVIIRAIGNALPPRHRASQTLSNLEFTLKYEEKMPNLQRHWLLNRIIDADVEERIIKLLQGYNESFTLFPFDLEEYRRIPYRFDRFSSFRGVPTRGNPQTDHEKILYTINVNGARNEMIDYGHKHTTADYILPWDGNCFLTRKAWEEITGKIANHTSHNYFLVPMDRLRDQNRAVVQENYKPLPKEEPQIIFRRGAQARFNPQLRYGWRNKEELLYRLGRFRKHVWAYPREEALIAAWTQSNPIQDLHPEQKVPYVGWVTRLSSGEHKAEGQQALRGRTRQQGVNNLLARLDARVVKERMKPNETKLLLFNDANLADISWQKSHVDAIEKMVHNADHALSLPLYLDDAYQNNKTELPDSLLGNVTALALAEKETGNATFASHALRLLNHWFIDNDSRLPTTFLEQSEPKRLVFQLRKLPWFLDALRLLHPFIPAESDKKLKNFFTRHFRLWMERGEVNAAAAMDQTTGLLFDMELLALLVHADQWDKVCVTIDRAASRWARSGNYTQCAMLTDCETLAVETWTNFATMANTLLGHSVKRQPKGSQLVAATDTFTSLLQQFGS